MTASKSETCQKIKPYKPLYVADTGDKGNGVFCSRRILKDELIEVCPMILVHKNKYRIPDKNILTNYFFEWDKDYEALPLGYGVMYNHSYSPNAHYYTSDDSSTFEFYAIKDIPANTEITINYNGAPECKSKLWFDVV